MKLIRILSVLLLSFGLTACGNSDSNDVKPAAVEAAETVEQASPATTPSASGFLESAQEAVDKAKQAAEEMEDAAQDTADQITNLSEEEED